MKENFQNFLGGDTEGASHFFSPPYGGNLLSIKKDAGRNELEVFCYCF